MNQIPKNTITILKTANISFREDKYLFAVYYYHSNKHDKNKSFYRCSIKLDYIDNWKKNIDSLLLSSPAEYFKTSMLGFDIDYYMIQSHKLFNKADTHRWLNTKLFNREPLSLSEFINTNFNSNKKETFIRKYLINGKYVDITEIDNIPIGIWYSETYEKKPRKSYGRFVF